MVNDAQFDDALAESNARYLNAMADHAEQLRGADDIDHAKWAEALKYIRVNGSGVRPISICNDNPCGALEGFDGSSPVSPDLRKGIDAPVAALSPNARKNELRLQARLIEHALRSPETLPALLHLSEQCDELRLVTDELKVNNVRADVVLLGRKGEVYFPVFIELKNDRTLDRLIEQLNNIVQYVGEYPAARMAFERFAMAYGNPNIAGPFDFDRRITVIIWPALADPSRAPARTRDLVAGLHVLEFAEGYPNQPLPRMGLSFVNQHYSK